MAAEAGLKTWECEAISPHDIWIHINAHLNNQRNAWERTRSLEWFIHTHSMIDKKHKAKSPQKLHPLPWDEDVPINPKEIMEAYLKRKKIGAGTKNIHQG